VTEKRLSLIDKLVLTILALMVLFVVMIPFLSVLEQEETKDNTSPGRERVLVSWLKTTLCWNNRILWSNSQQ
jgi:cytochrome c-type biogenesis protein CcmH/NrfF